MSSLSDNVSVQPGSPAVLGASGRVHSVLLTIAGAVGIALTAQAEIPFWPVPLTGQTFGVLLAAALLGRERGTMSVLLYLAAGALGLPVFAGGASGVTALLGPTGGYLIGFIVAAGIVGTLLGRRWAGGWAGTIAALTAGTFAIWICGVVWLGAFIGWKQAVVHGVAPFIVNAVVKILLVAAVVRAVQSAKRTA